MNIKMVDLGGQYLKIKEEIDSSMQHVINTSQFISGAKVKDFAKNLALFHSANYAITCANGTDALQIAFMALDLKRGDEVIVPAFTYVATAEVIALLGLTPVLVDVEWDTFNISPKKIEEAITNKTKAIVPVHLFGQCANMGEIMRIAKEHNLYVIEDNAQSIGAVYTPGEGEVLSGRKMSGTIGDIGCTSFFPSKNLGAYGDGGAMVTNNQALSEKLHCIANHGQVVKYHHSMVGCNSRLDTIQAAVLDVKLKYLNEYIASRQKAAKYYLDELKDIEGIELPVTASYTTHVYHQFTIKVKDGKRDELKAFLAQKEIPTMIYYPLPLHHQQAYSSIAKVAGGVAATQGGDLLKNSTQLSECVLSLPMHTELPYEQLNYICKAIKAFYR
ncbi:MAG: DegT/DnrJ/EryC1/StrS family aminotransferase [Bacteroidia bacterium]|nr:DegT/DnrJ/EryC1/StrS family aminotransferase [Bacteroidia bacterium]